MISFFLDQHGCAKNQVDGELIINHLLDMGIIQTFEPEKADFIIVNSCGFIESAKKESVDAVCFAKYQYPNAKILLTGCLAERYAQIFKENFDEADGIFGNGDLCQIKKIIQPLLNDCRPVLVPLQQGVCSGERRMFLSFRGSAFVKITEGCSNHCTFCAIPVIRGELRSRSAEEIINEIKSLISKGIVEINLIGQDLAAYGTGKNDNVFSKGQFPLPETCVYGKTECPSALSLLLKKISEIEGKFILRLLYIHPDHFNCDILPVIKSDKRFLPYFDIPFQSGDDSVILAMNRKGSVERYKKLVSEIRKILPNAVLRTTFLTGFPGENENSAENTRRFLKEIKSDWSGCFPYSKEEDTPAYFMKNKPSFKIAQQRADRLKEIQKEITNESLKKHIRKEYDILLEEILEGKEGIAIGRAWFQAPEVDGSVVVRYEKSLNLSSIIKPGRFIKVKIKGVSGVDLKGIFISDSDLNSNKEDAYLSFAPEIQKL